MSATYCNYCGTYGHVAEDCPEQPVQHYAVGHNVSGYLPECDVVVFPSFEEAKSALIYNLLWLADHVAETETIAEDLDAAAQDVNLWNGADVCYVDMIDSEHCLPTAFWIVATDEDCEAES